MDLHGLNIFNWLEEHKDELKPPVSNKQIFASEDYIVMVVAGPNHRFDFHYNETSEFFFQLKGHIFLDLQSDDGVKTVQLNAGEMYLVNPKMYHRPRRPEGSVGLVIERVREIHHTDALAWFCPKCNHRLYHESFELKSIEKDLLPVIYRFNSKPSHKICPKCQTQHP